MHFLTGDILSSEIRSILTEEDCCAAVAFWGRGCEDWVTGGGARVIANLAMGGTNPFALRGIQAELRASDRLHAKVFIGGGRAIIGSANASINGLALQGTETAGWIEAGYLCTEIEEIQNWFEELWTACSASISESVWRSAEEAWSRRVFTMPAPFSFKDFEPARDNLPFVIWVKHEDSEFNEEILDNVVGGLRTSPTFQRRLDEGVEVRDGRDTEILKNRWVLFWSIRSDEYPDRRSSPRLVFTSNQIIEDVYRSENEHLWQDLVLAAEDPPAPPVPVGDRIFRLALYITLAKNDFSIFRSAEVQGEAWYSKTLPHLREFWTDVKAEYNKKTG